MNVILSTDRIKQLLTTETELKRLAGPSVSTLMVIFNCGNF